MIAVRFRYWPKRQADTVLSDIVVQDHVEPCRPADIACIVFTVELAASVAHMIITKYVYKVYISTKLSLPRQFLQTVFCQHCL